MVLLTNLLLCDKMIAELPSTQAQIIQKRNQCHRRTSLSVWYLLTPECWNAMDQHASCSYEFSSVRMLSVTIILRR